MIDCYFLLNQSRRLAMVLAAALIAITATAQVKKGEKLMAERRYEEAVRFLKKDFNSGNLDAGHMLARCYYKLQDYQEALDVMNQIDASRMKTHEQMRFYTDVFIANDDYASALLNMVQTFADNRFDAENDTWLSKVNNLIRWDTLYTGNQLYPVYGINTSYNEHSPYFTKKKELWFVTDINSIQSIFPASYNDQNLNLIYKTTPRNGTGDEVSKPAMLMKTRRYPYHDGHMDEWPGKNRYAVTMSDMNLPPLASKQAIYFTKLKGTTDDLEPFPYNEKYNTAYPSFTSDGKRMYFASDRPGGQGGMDIWYSEYTEKGWSPPQNAGNVINTPANEVYPRVFGQRLYFSSDRMDTGYGGLDIYYTAANADATVVHNLMAPINSAYDDFSPSLIRSDFGYFTSNRRGGAGGDDIYAFKFVPQVYILPEIILTVETDMPWTSIPFELRDPAGNVFVEGVLQRGRPFPLRDFGTNSPYVFVVKEEGTVPENASVQIQTMGGTVIFTQPLVSNNEENTTLELLEDLDYYLGIMRAEDERARRRLEAEILAMEAAKSAGNQDVSQQQPHSEGTTTHPNGTHQVPTSQLASAPKPTSQHVAYASASTREQRVPGHVATALATTSDSYTADAAQGIAAQPATQKEYAPLTSANQSTATANGANDTEHAKGAQPMAQSHLATQAQAVGSNGAGDVQNTIQPVTAQSAVVIQNTPSYTANTAREMENTAAATSALPSGSADAVHASSRQEPSAKNTTSGQNAITPKADESTAAKSHAAASLADVYFAFDRADLDADNLNLLGGVIQWLKENPEAHLEIQAHADSRGSHVYNMNLSQRRANMVLDALAGAGIDPSRLKAVGYGETRPINHCIDGVPCSNSDHALNRRTTFVPVYPS